MRKGPSQPWLGAAPRGDVDAEMPHDGQRVAGREVAPLVEDPVVRQVVLVVAGHHLAAQQEGRGVAGTSVVVDEGEFLDAMLREDL